MHAITLSDLMTREVMRIDIQAGLGRASTLMASAGISSLLVEDAGRPVGILTERDVLRALHRGAAGETAVAEEMGSPLVTASADLEIYEAYHILASRGIRHLLVTDAAGAALGIVTESDFQRVLSGDFFRRLRDVAAVMAPQVLTLPLSARLGEAVALLEGHPGQCVLVLADGRPAGILTERDMVRLYAQGQARPERPAAEVMTAPVASVPVGMPLPDALDIMRARRYRHLAVVEANGALAGMVSEHDIVRHLEDFYLEIALKERARSEMDRRVLSRAVEQSPVSIVITDTEGRIQYVNPKFSEITGYTSEEALGQNPRILKSGLTSPEVYREMWTTLTAGGVWRGELCNRRKDGGFYWEHARILAITDVDGRPSHYLAVKEDVSERRQAEDKLRLAASVFDHSHEGILITDARGIILDVNRAFTDLTGYGRAEAIGQPARMLASGHHGKDFFERIFAEVASQGCWRGEVWNRTRAGAVAVVLMTISAVRDAEGGVGHYVGIFTDITQKKESELRLEHMAHYDMLTGLPNRALLADRLRQAMAQARRDNRLLAVCYLDLDGFKPINDEYGHATGDRLLVEIAERLRHVLRAGDTAARLGGDEFVLLLRDLGGIAELEQVLQRTMHAIAMPYQVGGHLLRISASMGVTIHPRDGGDADTLLRHADRAMYLAKEAGRGTYMLFDTEQDQRARQLRALLADVRRGLEAGEFQLYFQPKVGLCTGGVEGFEALLRWRHPGRGLLSPGDFLGDLGDTDVIVEIGEWTLREALRILALWRCRQNVDMRISVNIAARHLQHPRFLPNLLTMLAEQPTVPARCLELEILETAAIEDMAQVSEIIRACQRVGVQFALDDFGTGYSSLAYFKTLPAQTLKIDQSFVRDMMEDPEALAIVEGVIGLTTAFQRNVVAEGVERIDQGMLLSRLGCIQGQGYVIARPMPAEAVPDWLAAYRPHPDWLETADEQWLRDDFPLLAAEVDHNQWIKRVSQAIERGWADHAGLDPQAVDDHHACRFGRWYYRHGLSNYGDIEAMSHLEPVHQRVHALAIEALTHIRAGRLAQGQALLPAIRASRDELLTILREVQRAVSRRHD